MRKQRTVFTLALILALALSSLVFQTGITLAAVVSPFDMCSGVFTATVGANTDTLHIYRGDVAAWNDTNAPVSTDVTFVGNGTITASYHNLEGSPDLSVADASSVIQWSQPQAAGVNMFSKNLLLANGNMIANSAIVFAASPDTTGLLTFGSEIVEYYKGGVVTRNETSSAINGSISEIQLISGGAPFGSDGYTLSGATSPMAFSANSTPYSPVKTSGGMGGTQAWKLDLANDQMPANSAFVTYFCGGSGQAAPVAPVTGAARLCSFNPVAGMVVYAQGPVIKRAGPSENAINHGTIASGTAVTITTWTINPDCWISNGTNWVAGWLFTTSNGGGSVAQSTGKCVDNPVGGNGIIVKPGDSVPAGSAYFQKAGNTADGVVLGATRQDVGASFNTTVWGQYWKWDMVDSSTGALLQANSTDCRAQIESWWDAGNWHAG